MARPAAESPQSVLHLHIPAHHARPRVRGCQYMLIRAWRCRRRLSALEVDRPQRKACRTDCAIRTANVSCINAFSLAIG
jgi:hypothetical protein